jgi:hypothetical protein
MTFVAKLRRHSPVWKAWQHRHATAGEICGVAFRWLPGGDYVTDELTADQVMRLRGQSDATLEAYGNGATDASDEPRRVPEPVVPVSDATVARAGTLTLDEAARASIPHTPGWRKRLRELERAAARH